MTKEMALSERFTVLGGFVDVALLPAHNDLSVGTVLVGEEQVKKRRCLRKCHVRCHVELWKLRNRLHRKHSRLLQTATRYGVNCMGLQTNCEAVWTLGPVTSESGEGVDLNALCGGASGIPSTQNTIRAPHIQST